MKAPVAKHRGKFTLPATKAGSTATPRPRISENALVMAHKAPTRAQTAAAFKQSLRMPTYAKGVLPDGQTKLAMDDASGADINAAWSWAGNLAYHGMWAEGIGFMGYPYLAELSQRSEYRVPCEVIAEEMTRKWITISSTSEGEEETEKVKELNESVERFQLREVFERALALEGIMGLSQIYIDLLDGAGRPVYDNEAEAMAPLLVKEGKIGKDSLRGFKVIDPTWVAPNEYNTNNPMSPQFYVPQMWYVMGKRVHATRLLSIVSRPVPDMLKPAYNFGGLSLQQLMKPYVDNWLSTRQAVNDIIQSFTTWVLKTNMEAILSGAGGDDMDRRIELFTLLKTNRGVMALDKDTEEFANVSAPLGTLDHLQAQAQEHMAAPARIPLVKLFGITPSGLNTSTDGEVRTFYDSIHARQERVMGALVRQCLEIIQLHLWGKINESITFTFDQLWELDEAGQAATRKVDADTAAVMLQEGVVDPDEVRKVIAADPKSPFHGLKGDAPEPDPTELGMGMPGMEDNANKVANAGASGATTGANSGV